MARKKYTSEPIKQQKTVKNKEYLTMDVYRGSQSLAELQKIRRTLSKRANQRILRLERNSSKITNEQYNTFGGVTDVYHYLDTQDEGKRRFTERLNAITDSAKLKREITVLQGFLGRKTSLVSGMREIEKKRMSTFETGKWGTSWKNNKVPNRQIHFASNKEFYDFLNSETFKGLVSSGFTSEQIIEIYDNTRVKVDTGAKGQEDITAQAMVQALKDYREKGNASLKDLRKRMNSVKLKGSYNK